MNDLKRVFVIAEAGSNHNGSLKQAQKLIDVARDAGADAVKFQVFRAQTMYPDRRIEVKYLKDSGIKDSLYDIIRKMEIPPDWIPKLHRHCRRRGIAFLATPFDLDAVRWLDPYVDFFKIASYEALYLDLLKAVRRTGKPLIISTGGSTLKEIDLLMRKGLRGYRDRTVLLHCIAKYPAPIEQAGLAVLPFLARRYGVQVGYSDHTRHPLIAPVLAVGLGARVIEKHFTLDRRLPGPDHAFAIEPDELRAMVSAIRDAERAIEGGGSRPLQACERELYYYKRCLYCVQDMPRGHRLSRRDLKVLRNTGIRRPYFNPLEADRVIGLRLRLAKREDDILFQGDLL